MECMNLNNFGGMGAIMAGLNNSYVQSFKEKWNKIDGESKKNFEKMEELLSPSFNFALYRKTVEEIEKEAKKPYLPYMAIHLRDILSLQEIFENSEEAKEMIEHSIENGKKIFSALKAQNIKFELKKETEIYEYMKSVKPLSSKQIFDLQFNKTPEVSKSASKIRKNSEPYFEKANSVNSKKKLSDVSDLGERALEEIKSNLFAKLNKENSLEDLKEVLDPKLSIRECLRAIMNNYRCRIKFEDILNKNLSISNWFFWLEIFDITENFMNDDIGDENSDQLLFEKLKNLIKRF